MQAILGSGSDSDCACVQLSFFTIKFFIRANLTRYTYVTVRIRIYTYVYRRVDEDTGTLSDDDKALTRRLA
jgi:hypothetical protein